MTDLATALFEYQYNILLPIVKTENCWSGLLA
jgi:hypothetical protein